MEEMDGANNRKLVITISATALVILLLVLAAMWLGSKDHKITLSGLFKPNTSTNSTGGSTGSSTNTTPTTKTVAPTLPAQSVTLASGCTAEVPVTAKVVKSVQDKDTKTCITEVSYPGEDLIAVKTHFHGFSQTKASKDGKQVLLEKGKTKVAIGPLTFTDSGKPVDIITSIQETTP